MFYIIAQYTFWFAILFLLITIAPSASDYPLPEIVLDTFQNVVRLFKAFTSLPIIEHIFSWFLWIFRLIVLVLVFRGLVYIVSLITGHDKINKVSP